MASLCRTLNSYYFTNFLIPWVISRVNFYAQLS